MRERERERAGHGDLFTQDRAILVITFLLPVFADLVVAVNVGVIRAILHFLCRMSEMVKTQPVDSNALGRELDDMERVTS